MGRGTIVICIGLVSILASQLLIIDQPDAVLCSDHPSLCSSAIDAAATPLTVRQRVIICIDVLNRGSFFFSPPQKIK